MLGSRGVLPEFLHRSLAFSDTNSGRPDASQASEPPQSVQQWTAENFDPALSGLHLRIVVDWLDYLFTATLTHREGQRNEADGEATVATAQRCAELGHLRLA
ncbi:hypothetical protein CMUS01_13383 [Colletotrichum musicola]|uniref:Uncharacterized protein n=1 Tax=Colletotrichum musicola TaxID=2175873 RepID=A0A8H6MWH3_9PEZI|nr:hypothetical protein CMUS01_13383 [Colletotrichum musicola]